MCIFIIYLFILFSVIAIQIDDLSYTRDYDIRQYNYISHCDHFSLQEQHYLVKIVYYREKQDILLQIRLYSSNKQKIPKNSMVIFTSSVFNRKYSFWEKLVQKIKIVSLCWNLVSKMISIIFWDFLKFYQIFLSLQVKWYAIITYKTSIYQLPHELPNDLRLRILGN